MKFPLQKHSIPESRIFVVKELKEKHFDATWHAHDEYQLFIVLKGTGTRFIGNTIKAFKEGDITFLGPGIPHLWRSDSAYFDKQSKQLTHGMVIYFKENFIGDLLDKEEMQQVRSLFTKAKRAIEYFGDTAGRVAGMIKNIALAHGVESLVQLLKILEELAITKEYSLLHNDNYTYNLKESETQRINLVYNYAAQHFLKEVTLKEAADLLHMTPTSFSRYFKMRTSKSFFEFVVELRIKHACKLLSEDDRKSINQVADACGFNTLSNFNRQFLKCMNMTPKIYRREFSTL